MKIELVEIYSDETNRAVMRHPSRQFPGILMQGDNLHSLCMEMDALCAQLRSESSDSQEAANRIRKTLWSYLTHYKQVLGERDIRLPFSDIPLAE
jgi:hypothetical protein